MSDVQNYDVVVIGSGPGGEGAAMQAVKHGLKVAVVEKMPMIGGSCTHTGTIPSKALRFAIFQAMEFRSNPLFRTLGSAADVNLPQMRKTAQRVIDQQVTMRQSFYDRNDVPVLNGTARFLDKQTIEVLHADGGHTVLASKNFVIATGARPYRPANVDFNHPCVFDSDTILGLNRDIKSLTVYGAGVIGCEYASMFRNMDVKINLINTRDKLLDYLDEEIIDALSYHLRERGVLIRNREEFDHLDCTNDGVVVTLKSGKKLKTDALLWAAGRTGNSDGMGLDTIGIKTDSRQNIPVNAQFQTAVPTIYAVGDVIGFPALASAATCRDAPQPATFSAKEISARSKISRRNLHEPRDQFTRQDRKGTHRVEDSVRSRSCPLQESGPRPDHRPDRRNAEAAVPSRDARTARHPLLWSQRQRDHPHRPGDSDAASAE